MTTDEREVAPPARPGTTASRVLPENWVGLAIGLVLGTPFMIVGLRGLLQHQRATPPANFLRFFVGVNILHDAIVAPIACIVGLFFVQRLPRLFRAPVRAGLFGTAVLVAIAWPALRMYGRDRVPDNPSVQPLNYATAVGWAVLIVWAVCALWLAVAWLRERARRKPHTASDTVAR